MNRFHIHIPQRTEALQAAAAELARAGVSFADDERSANVLLLPCPTPPELLPHGETPLLVVGGRLPSRLKDRIDLLEDPRYVSVNAAITAEAALGLLLTRRPTVLRDEEILLLGWGRIGKALARMLQNLGAGLTVCVRSAKDQGLLEALGIRCLPVEALPEEAGRYSCIINTVPAALIGPQVPLHPDCFLMELASGQFLPGPEVLEARGLPGRMKPRSSGKVMAACLIEELKRRITP